LGDLSVSFVGYSRPPPPERANLSKEFAMKKLPVALLLAATAFAVACNNSNAGDGAKGAANSSGGVGGSGSDYYYEMTAKGGGKGFNMNMTTRVYCSSAGKVRMEMLVGIDTNGTAVKRDPATVIIGDAHTPTVTYDLDAATRTYTKNLVDTSGAGPGFKTEATVEKMGDETVHGFSCVHARVIAKKSMGQFYSLVDTTDLWTSKEVPMQADFQHWYNSFQKKNGGGLFTPDVNEKMQQMGAAGFYVRMQMRGKNSNVTMDLTKAERRDLAGSLFEIPAGYTETKN
jgi:hypothetical protein